MLMIRPQKEITLNPRFQRYELCQCILFPIPFDKEKNYKIEKQATNQKRYGL
jgi:hypothetical protein